MSNLENTILGELNRRANRYKYFQALQLKQTGLEEMRSTDINWIKRNVGNESQDYIHYYSRMIGV